MPDSPSAALRPSILNPLFAPAGSLPGVGPKIASLLDRLLGEPERPARVVDLLFHLPHGRRRPCAQGLDRRGADRRARDAQGAVAEHRPGLQRGKAPYRVLVEDESGDVMLVFFNTPRERIQRLLPLGATRYVSGKLELWDGYRQMVHPDRILDERGIGDLPAVEAVYGLTEGVSSRHRRQVRRPPRWSAAGPARMAGRGLASGATRFPAFGEALQRLHRPPDAAEAEAEAIAASPARRRLAYDELLASQLALALVRSRMRRQPGRGNAGDGRLVATVTARPALRAHRRPGAGARGHPPRHGLRQAHAAPAPGRCRLRQDGGRASRHGERDRGGPPGRHDGADRDPGAPAFRAHRAPRRARPACALALLTGRDKGAERRAGARSRSPRARSTSRSAPMRCSRRRSSSATSASRSSTSSTASACTSAWRSAPRAPRSTCSS